MEQRVIDERTIELIAQRVIAAIRDDLDAIAAELSSSRQATEQLTVGQIAERLGVARSTVYAHWREWGGYKLGTGDKAPIRFDGTALPVASSLSLASSGRSWRLASNWRRTCVRTQAVALPTPPARPDHRHAQVGASAQLVEGV